MIKSGEYKIISNFFDDMLVSTKEAAYKMIDMSNVLNKTDTQKLSQSFSRILTSIESTYSVVVKDVITYPPVLTSYVVAIHRHILSKYKPVGSIDNFLEENYLEVGQSFADLCNELGYNITRIGLMAARWSDIYTNIDEIETGKYSGLKLTWDNIGGTNTCLDFFHDWEDGDRL